MRQSEYTARRRRQPSHGRATRRKHRAVCASCHRGEDTGANYDSWNVLGPRLAEVGDLVPTHTTKGVLGGLGVLKTATHGCHCGGARMMSRGPTRSFARVDKNDDCDAMEAVLQGTSGGLRRQRKHLISADTRVLKAVENIPDR